MQTTFFKFSFVLLISTLLAACGAERDTPFNPSGGTSSSSSIPVGATVTMTKIYESEAPQPTYFNTTNKQIITIRTQDEFDYFWDNYASGQTFNEIDFELGQVILLDLGNIGTCTQLLTYRSNKANDFSNNTVRVVFSYRDTQNSSAQNSSANSSYSESSCANTENKRPFYFYYVESRKKIVVEEQVIY
jgi:hypothetical protein